MYLVWNHFYTLKIHSLQIKMNGIISCTKKKKLVL